MLLNRHRKEQELKKVEEIKKIVKVEKKKVVKVEKKKGEK